MGPAPDACQECPRARQARLNPLGGNLVNVAYLLVTTAWLSGQTPPPAPAPAGKPAPAPVVAAAPVVATSSCSTCNTCNTCESESFCTRLRNRLSGLFSGGGHHSSDCGCATAPTCNTCAPAPKPVCCAPAPAPKPCCEPAPKPVCCAPAPAPKCCAPAPAPSCSTCNSGCGGESLIDKLRNRLSGLFSSHHRQSDCGCAAPAPSCCGTAVAPKAGETIPAPTDPPKKMPEGGKTTGIITPTSPIPVNAPALEAAPSIVTPPGITEQRRDF